MHNQTGVEMSRQWPALVRRILVGVSLQHARHFQQCVANACVHTHLLDALVKGLQLLAQQLVVGLALAAWGQARDISGGRLHVRGQAHGQRQGGGSQGSASGLLGLLHSGPGDDGPAGRPGRGGLRTSTHADRAAQRKCSDALMLWRAAGGEVSVLAIAKILSLLSRDEGRPASATRSGRHHAFDPDTAVASTAERTCCSPGDGRVAPNTHHGGPHLHLRQRSHFNC